MQVITRAEVIKYLEDFLSGHGNDYDWDDFFSGHYKNRELDAIALICAKLPDIYPREKPGQYCGEEGLQFLRHVLLYLKSRP